MEIFVVLEFLIILTLLRLVWKTGSADMLLLRQENLLLRTKRKRAPKTKLIQRLKILLLLPLVKNWRRKLTVLTPETILQWRQKVFRDFWAAISQRKKRPGRKKTPAETRDIVLRLYRENCGWGAPRIHLEMKRLGHSVSESTISRILREEFTDYRDRLQRNRQQWVTFLRNHRVVAMDFFTIPTAWKFQMFHALFLICHRSRRIIHWNVTANPTQSWVKQQLREALPEEPDFSHLLCDNDSRFGADIDGLMEAVKMKTVRTSFRSPWQNGYAERMVGTFRRDCTNHILFTSEKQIRGVLGEYVVYYNHHRPHSALGQSPLPITEAQPRPSPDAKLVATPVLGGLHHIYSWAA